MTCGTPLATKGDKFRLVPSGEVSRMALNNGFCCQFSGRQGSKVLIIVFISFLRIVAHCGVCEGKSGPEAQIFRRFSVAGTVSK